MQAKTYLITGTSSGIGLEMVRQLAARGERVFATCRKKGSSLSGVDNISSVQGNVTVIEGVDVAKDDVGEVLANFALPGQTIDVVVHNAGSVNGTRDVDPKEIMSEQGLSSVSMDRMRAAFEVNTLGPLRVQNTVRIEHFGPSRHVSPAGPLQGGLRSPPGPPA